MLSGWFFLLDRGMCAAVWAIFGLWQGRGEHTCMKSI